MNVHAPCAGKITAITRVATAHHPNVPAVEIETAGMSAPAIPVTATPPATQQLTTAQLADIADRAGIVFGSRPATALGDRLRRAQSLKTRDLIISGLPDEPLVNAGPELLRRNLESTVTAGLLVRDTMHADRAWIAVDRRDRDLLTRCRQAVNGTPLRVAALPDKYPQAAPVLLAWAITGKQTPIGRQPHDIGCFVLEVEPLLALAEATRSGRPMVARTVNVVGPTVARPSLYNIPMGTSFADVLRHVGLARSVAQVIEGGPLTGSAVESLDAVVTKQTTAILVLNHEHDRLPAPGPCIRCGFCHDTCPVGLDPLALLDAAERRDLARARTLHPTACLACGLCSYVCPAELPLAQAASRLQTIATHNHQPSGSGSTDVRRT
jgi:electron transport complex protein RnfC